MKYKILILIILLPITGLAQSQLNGKWKGTIIMNGDKNIVLAHEWIIDKDNIKINLINLTKFETKEWDNFEYTVSKEKLELSNDALTITFSIVLQEKNKLIIQNREDNYIISLNKQGLVNKIDFKIPYSKGFRLKQEEYNEFSFYFTSFDVDDFILTFKKDSLIDVSEISHFRDSTYTEIIVELNDDIIDYLIINELNGSSVSGLLDGKTTFSFEKIVIEPIITKKQLTSKKIIEDKPNSNRFCLSLENGKVKQIDIGNNKLSLESKNVGEYKYWTEVEGKNTFETAKVKWSLSNDNRLLFINYKDTNSEKFEVCYINNITEKSWCLKKYTALAYGLHSW